MRSIQGCFAGMEVRTNYVTVDNIMVCPFFIVF